MVGEFPELQGIMGGYYAAHDGEPPEVAAAIRDQYVNRRGESDSGATNLVGEALLIADRAETLVGIWGIGLKPTGDKDPFALRRHALDADRLVATRRRRRIGRCRSRCATLLEQVASTFGVAARRRHRRRGRVVRLRALLPAARGRSTTRARSTR